MAVKTSGAISFLDIRNEFGGTAPNSLSQYYRGGALVPSIRNTFVREPASGYADHSKLTYIWVEGNNLIWNGTVVASGISGTSLTVGEWTYYRGVQVVGNGYNVYRSKGSTEAINTNVPTSGAISFSQFYGATKT